jgi:hypothetical protein
MYASTVSLFIKVENWTHLRLGLLSLTALFVASSSSKVKDNDKDAELLNKLVSKFSAVAILFYK